MLAIDVGNTSTSFGFFSLHQNRIPAPAYVFRVPTSNLNKRAVLRTAFHKSFKRRSLKADHVLAVFVSSVVPPVDAFLKSFLLDFFKKAGVHFVSARSKTKIKIHYKTPSEVGADRIVNARAATALYAGPSVIIDFGTATTFDCVSGKGEYLGGVIAPGPVISAEALYQKTAKLPHVLLEKPVKILGRNTLESIQSGLYHGYRGLVKEITSLLKKKLGPRTKVMATGGQAHWILKGLPIVDRHIPHLTLMGLYFMWQDARNSG